MSTTAPAQIRRSLTFGSIFFGMACILPTHKDAAGNLGRFIVIMNRKKTAAELASLSADQRERHDQIVAADSAVKQAQKEYGQRVAREERVFKTATTPEPIVKTMSYEVTPLEVRMNRKTHPMSSAVNAVFEIEGERRAEVAVKNSRSKTGMGGVAMGVGPALVGAGGSKGKTKFNNEIVQVDSREAFVTVSGPGWADSMKFAADKGEEARRLAAAINAAAADYERFAPAHAAKVAECQAVLDAAKAERSNLDRALAARAALGDDPVKVLRANRKAGGAALPPQ